MPSARRHFAIYRANSGAFIVFAISSSAITREADILPEMRGVSNQCRFMCGAYAACAPYHMADITGGAKYVCHERGREAN